MLLPSDQPHGTGFLQTSSSISFSDQLACHGPRNFFMFFLRRLIIRCIWTCYVPMRSLMLETGEDDVGGDSGGGSGGSAL